VSAPAFPQQRRQPAFQAVDLLPQSIDPDPQNHKQNQRHENKDDFETTGSRHMSPQRITLVAAFHAPPIHGSLSYMRYIVSRSAAAHNILEHLLGW
jgi:hypothetical protein